MKIGPEFTKAAVACCEIFEIQENSAETWEPVRESDIATLREKPHEAQHVYYKGRQDLHSCINVLLLLFLKSSRWWKKKKEYKESSEIM